MNRILTFLAFVSALGLSSLPAAESADAPQAGKIPYLEKVFETVRAFPPESLAVDTAGCLSKAKKRQLASFDWVFRSNVFAKADCLKYLHAYKSKEASAPYTSVYVMSFRPNNLARVEKRLRKEKLPIFPRLKSSEYYKWHVVDGKLVLLVLEGTPEELFQHIDTMTVEYLKPSSPSPVTGGAAHE